MSVHQNSGVHSFGFYISVIILLCKIDHTYIPMTVG